MKKRLASIMMIFAMMTAWVIPVRAEPSVTAPSVILMERSTGQVLYEKQSHDKLAPASVTKVMTLLLVMEALESGRISWNDTVTTSAAAAAKGGSQIYLEEGEKMPLEDVLKAVVVSSANDGATALAEHIAGSEDAFVTMMNERAAALGMNDTHFVNCTGLDDDPDAAEHLTSAHDIAVMSRQLLQHDAIRKYTTIWMDTVRNGEFGLTNTNKLVRFYDGATGLKTGYTSGAGYCLSASAMRDGMELIAVVMNCKTSVERFESAKALLNYGFANYCMVQPQPTEELTPVPVTMGTEESVLPLVSQTQPVLLDKGLQKSVTTKADLEQSLQAPVSRGQTIGTLTMEANGQVLAKIPLVADRDVPRLTWWQVTKQLLRGICMG